MGPATINGPTMDPIFLGTVKTVQNGIPKIPVVCKSWLYNVIQQHVPHHSIDTSYPGIWKNASSQTGPSPHRAASRGGRPDRVFVIYLQLSPEK